MILNHSLIIFYSSLINSHSKKIRVQPEKLVDLLICTAKKVKKWIKVIIISIWKDDLWVTIRFQKCKWILKRYRQIKIKNQIRIWSKQPHLHSFIISKMPSRVTCIILIKMFQHQILSLHFKMITKGLIHRKRFFLKSFLVHHLSLIENYILIIKMIILILLKNSKK